MTSTTTHPAPIHTLARPAQPPAPPLEQPTMAKVRSCEVLVLDTGLAATTFLPSFFGDVKPLRMNDVDHPDESGDGYIDPVAGHGTFIAGIIERLAPAATIRIERVLTTFGDGDDAAIGGALERVLDLVPLPDIISLSLSAYTEDDRAPAAIAGAVAKLQDHGVVIVASAGNDATCRPAWPAALPDVVSVGAIGPYGPAPFTNFGAWVRACAPGVDVVSKYFRNADDGAGTLPANTDLKDFHGWATWSGTSFSAPFVAGVLAREVITRDISAEDAVTRIIDEPSLLRLPLLGTVVNG